MRVSYGVDNTVYHSSAQFHEANARRWNWRKFFSETKSLTGNLRSDRFAVTLNDCTQVPSCRGNSRIRHDVPRPPIRPHSCCNGSSVLLRTKRAKLFVVLRFERIFFLVSDCEILSLFAFCSNAKCINYNEDVNLYCILICVRSNELKYIMCTTTTIYISNAKCVATACVCARCVRLAAV